VRPLAEISRSSTVPDATGAGDTGSSERDCLEPTGRQVGSARRQVSSGGER
jgi:hypothetical protein